MRHKLLLLFLSTLLLVGCAEVEKDTVIDCRHNEAYTETVIDYEYEYNWHESKYELVPNVHTEYHPESYELYHEYVYTDGNTARHWKECTYTEYKNYMEEIYQ